MSESRTLPQSAGVQANSHFSGDALNTVRGARVRRSAIEYPTTCLLPAIPGQPGAPIPAARGSHLRSLTCSRAAIASAVPRPAKGWADRGRPFNATLLLRQRYSITNNVLNTTFVQSLRGATASSPLYKGRNRTCSGGAWNNVQVAALNPIKSNCYSLPNIYLGCFTDGPRLTI